MFCLPVLLTDSNSRCFLNVRCVKFKLLFDRKGTISQTSVGEITNNNVSLLGSCEINKCCFHYVFIIDLFMEKSYLNWL